MYRSREQKQQMNKQTNKTWFKKLGYTATAAIQMTVENKLQDKLGKALQGSKWPIKLTNSCGNTVGQTLRRSNPNPAQLCNRKNCIMCLQAESGSTNIKCYKSKIAYRFACARSPCSEAVNLAKLGTDDLIKQLENNNTGRLPALYEGTSYRTSFARTGQHISLYNSKKNKLKSWMYQHSAAVYGGIIGRQSYKTGR